MITTANSIMVFEKSTKTTHVYVAKPDQAPVVATLYYPKWAITGAPPKEITVTVTENS